MCLLTGWRAEPLSFRSKEEKLPVALAIGRALCEDVVQTFPKSIDIDIWPEVLIPEF